jgi:hypothetical protein
MSCTAQYNQTARTMAVFGCAADSAAVTVPHLIHEGDGRAVLIYPDGRFVTQSEADPQPQTIGDILDSQWVEEQSGQPADMQVVVISSSGTS